MTTISAWKFPTTSGDRPEGIVFLADSMTSVGEHNKMDISQKLFSIGDLLIMNAGDRMAALSAIDHLASLETVGEAPATVDACADAILGHLTEYNQTAAPHDVTTFIVGGVEDGEPVLKRVYAGNIEDYQFNREIAATRRTTHPVAAFAGIGEHYADQYFQNAQAMGIPFINLCAADALVLSAEVANISLSHQGVNDKLQIGIMTANGATTLYHPDVRLEADFIENSWSRLLGMPAPAYDPRSGKARITSIEERGHFGKVINDFFHAFDVTLKGYLNTRMWANNISNGWMYGLNTHAEQRWIKEKMNESRDDVIAGTEIMINPSFQGVRVYIEKYERERAHSRDVLEGRLHT